MVKALLLSLLLAVPVCAEQVAVNQFKGINNNENSTIISPEWAQDLLNVEITPGGKSVKKRDGYGLYKDLGTTQPVRGGAHFFDSTGNDIQVWGSSTSLYGIVSDGTPTQLVSSATLNSTWDCEDSQGSAYCVTSNRDFYLKTTGQAINWYTAPLGTMVTMTPDRAVVAGVSGNLNTLYVSAANNLISFTVGPLTTDAFNEVITAPGSKITHIRWGCGKLLWWKDQSFGYTEFEDQYNLQNITVSDNVGTFDNSSAQDPGGAIWFRGQDGHIYQYDCSSLTKESIEITPNVQASGRRTANFWTQTSQSDWQSGSAAQTGTLSFTISPGDVVPSSFTKTENSSSSGWGSGTASNTTVGTSSITLTLNNSGNTDNNSFETGSNGVCPTNYTCSSTGGVPMQKNSESWGTECSGGPGACAGTFSLLGNSSAAGGRTAFAAILDASSGATLTSTSMDLTVNHCTCTTASLSSSGLVGRRVKLKFSRTDPDGTSSATMDTSFILGGDISFQYANGTTQGNFFVDNILLGSSTVTSGTFTSQAINTGMPYSYVFTTATWTANSSTPTFTLQKSADGSAPWTEVTTTIGNSVSVDKQYVRYVATFTVAGTDSYALTALNSVQLIARSSGTYYSAVKNAPNIASWSTFNPNYVNNDGSNTFYIRRATQTFTVLSSTPSVWTALTPNALVTVATGTYFQIRDDMVVTAATHTPILTDFTVNWYEGSATDQAYLHYFDNAIWTSVAYGAGVSSNTYVFRRDLINDGWVLYNFGAGGFMTQNNNLFFGSVGSDDVFQFGSGTSDNGSAISAYWRSKSFTGPDPFLDNALMQIDTFAKKDANSTLTATYTLNTSTSTSYNVALSSAASIVQSRKQLPAGKNGYTFDIQYGDNSTSSAWELFGYRIGFNQLPYRPSN